MLKVFDWEPVWEESVEAVVDLHATPMKEQGPENQTDDPHLF